MINRILAIVLCIAFVVGAGLAITYWSRELFSPGVASLSTGPMVMDDGVSLEPIRPIPIPDELNQDKVLLGYRLFHEPRLSGDDSVSCAHCHDLGKGGTDRMARSVGINNQRGEINSPTVFNSSLNFKQFWDGRAVTLEEQIDGPIHDPKEMNTDWPSILTKLQSEPTYVTSFEYLYPNGIQVASVKDAIATFERSLATPNSRFDRYLRGDSDAITQEEKEGYQLFKGYGCTSCHQGVGAGGNMFATFGVMADYFADSKKVTRADLGRFNVTGKDSDRFRFKVPSLRNVALTAPYFHNGSAQTLEAAVDVMARYQLGRRLSTEETSQIVQFLHTLTGEYKGVLLK